MYEVEAQRLSIRQDLEFLLEHLNDYSIEQIKKINSSLNTIREVESQYRNEQSRRRGGQDR